MPSSFKIQYTSKPWGISDNLLKYLKATHMTSDTSNPYAIPDSPYPPPPKDPHERIMSKTIEESYNLVEKHLQSMEKSPEKTALQFILLMLDEEQSRNRGLRKKLAALKTQLDELRQELNEPKEDI